MSFIYKREKQNDGTYVILSSRFGLNWQIVLSGVRGCNVDRVINKFYKDDARKERQCNATPSSTPQPVV